MDNTAPLLDLLEGECSAKSTFILKWKLLNTLVACV
jgi:hypothetical protein